MRTRFLKGCLGLIAILVAGAVSADESPLWATEAPLEVVSMLREPAADEVVVVVNDNASLGNHTGLFAGSLLVDPAGSYIGKRSADRNWPGPTLADYARFQTMDGLNIRFYRFRLNPRAFAAIVQRMRDIGMTPPLFCASAVQNLLVGVPPFDGITPIRWTSPKGLVRVLDPLTQGERAVGECQTLTAAPC
jgi:hypothetical protein